MKAADHIRADESARADEEGTVARIRALRSELIDPAIASNRGRIVKTTGDGILVEFRSVVDAVRCAIEVQNGMVRTGYASTRTQLQTFRCVALSDVQGQKATSPVARSTLNLDAELSIEA